MKKLLLAASLGLTASISAFAQTPSTASVNELLIITKSEQMIDEMSKATESIIESTINQAQSSQDKPFNAAQQQAVKKYSQNFSKIMSDSLAWKEIKDDMVKIYASTFNQKEIDDLIAFYKTPTGQATIEKMPALMQQSMQLGQNAIQRTLPQLREAGETFYKEINAASDKK